LIDEIIASKMPSKKNDNRKDKENEEEKGNVFDRSVKEDSEFTFETFLEIQYGKKMRIKTYQPLQEKMPKTLEREVDFLYKITTEDDKEKLLHIEFQTKNSNRMIYRVQEYHGLISRKYNLPVKHLVVYYGKSKIKMVSKLPEEAIFRGFDLICLNEIEPENFLNSQAPEVVILTLLSKYTKKQVEEILSLMFNKLEKLPKYTNNPSRYINKLLLLSTLRNLDETITKKIKAMPIFTNEMIKNHALYKEGKEDAKAELRKELEIKESELRKAAQIKESELRKAAEKDKMQSIVGLHNAGVDIQIIAKSFNVTEERIKEVIADWEKQSPKE